MGVEVTVDTSYEYNKYIIVIYVIVNYKKYITTRRKNR